MEAARAWRALSPMAGMKATPRPAMIMMSVMVTSSSISVKAPRPRWLPLDMFDLPRALMELKAVNIVRFERSHLGKNPHAIGDGLIQAQDTVGARGGDRGHNIR